MNEEMKSQKEEFLLEVQKQILHKGLKSEMQENGRLHVKWNDQPLCEVDEYVSDTILWKITNQQSVTSLPVPNWWKVSAFFQMRNLPRFGMRANLC